MGPAENEPESQVQGMSRGGLQRDRKKILSATLVTCPAYISHITHVDTRKEKKKKNSSTMLL